MQQAGHTTSIKVKQLTLKLLAQLLVAHLDLPAAAAAAAGRCKIHRIVLVLVKVHVHA
jgi:hypothetical protein